MKYQNEKDDEPKLTIFAIIPTILCPMCFFFQYGYSIGTLNAASQPIRRFYNQSYMQRFGEPISQSYLDLIWTFSTTTFPIGGMIGSCFVKPLVANFGQRRSLIYTQVLSIVGTLLLSLSVLMLSYEAIMIGEVLLGMYCAVGLGNGFVLEVWTRRFEDSLPTVPFNQNIIYPLKKKAEYVTGVGSTYINDMSIPRIRGTVASLFGSAIAIGLIFGNLFALEQILGTDSGWPYLLAITAVPNLVFLGFIRWLPESPRSAYLTFNSETEAENLLIKLRGTTNVQSELDEYKSEAEFQKELLSVWQVLTKSSVRWQLVSAIVVLASVQITGINGVLYNMNNIFITAGLDPSYVTYVSVGVSAFQLLTAAVAGLLSARFGRKTIFFAGNSAVVISVVLYTLALAFQDSATWLSYIAVVATLGLVMGVNAGSGIVAYVVAPEILSQAARPAGMSIAVFVFWLSFAAVSFATPYMFAGLNFGVLLPYLATAILVMLYVYFFLPETKGMTSLEIEQYFMMRRQKRKTDKKSLSMGNNEVMLTAL